VGIDAAIRWFLPKEERFHEILGRNAENLVRGTRVFAEVARGTTLERRRVKAVELKGIEHEADQTTRQLFEALNSTFITPFDREDLRALGSGLDDILDYIESVAHHLVIFELNETPSGLKQFADILESLSAEVQKVTGLIWDLGNAQNIRDSLVRISDLENQGDALYSTVIADLFKVSDMHPLDVLKWKEIYQGLEQACDACKNYGHVLANIMAKNT